MIGLIFSLVLIAPSYLSAVFHEYIRIYRDNGESHSPSNIPDDVEISNISSFECGSYIQGFPMLTTKGIAKGLAPLPEREAAHLGDAIAGPRIFLFSQPPQAAKDNIGKPCSYINHTFTIRASLILLRQV